MNNQFCYCPCEKKLKENNRWAINIFCHKMQLLNDMLPDEAEAYLAKHGVESQLSKVILAGYKSLQLIHYFTAGPGEVRAWTVRVSIYFY